MEIILLLLAGFGLTSILVDSKIMETFRGWIGRIQFFDQLINCSMCTGFWVGLYYSVIMFFYLTLPSFGASVVVTKILFYFSTLPFATSGIAWLLERLTTIIDIKAYEVSETFLNSNPDVPSVVSGDIKTRGPEDGQNDRVYPWGIGSYQIR
jgi:hypothetical protein